MSNGKYPLPRKKPDDPELLRLGAALKRARERAGKRQQDVEAELGKSASYLGTLERGQGGSPSVLVVAQLAQIYGTSVEALLAEDDQPARAPKLDGELLGRIMQRIARLYREANITLDELELGRLAAKEHNVAAGATPDEWPTVLKLVEARTREAIAKDTPAQRTRRGA